MIQKGHSRDPNTLIIRTQYLENGWRQRLDPKDHQGKWPMAGNLMVTTHDSLASLLFLYVPCLVRPWGGVAVRWKLFFDADFTHWPLFSIGGSVRNYRSVPIREYRDGYLRYQWSGETGESPPLTKFWGSILCTALHCSCSISFRRTGSWAISAVVVLLTYLELGSGKW